MNMPKSLVKRMLNQMLKVESLLKGMKQREKILKKPKKLNPNLNVIMRIRAVVEIKKDANSHTK
jgi:hypothetical protein